MSVLLSKNALPAQVEPMVGFAVLLQMHVADRWDALVATAVTPAGAWA
jgi:hypothetical protein